jgi:hypothetical protein
MFWSAYSSTIVSRLETDRYATMQITILNFLVPSLSGYMFPEHPSIEIGGSVSLYVCPLSLGLLNLFRWSIISNGLEPLRVNILHLQVRRNIRLRVFLIAHGIAHTKMRPWILVLVLNVEVLVARGRNDFGVHV